jgi:hypothetical protein
MKRIALTLILFALGSLQALAQNEPDPPVIAMMEKLGTVYVTRRPAEGKKKASRADRAEPARAEAKKKKSVIIGVDFRPTMGSDPKEIAAAVKELSTLPELEFVLLLGRDVTDEAADAIPASAKINNIRFFNTKVTDKGIGNLTRFKGLRVFNYTGMLLSDAGMKELGKIKTLRTVMITDAKVSDEGVMSLQGLSSLQVLNVENTLATEAGIERLRRKLPSLGNDFLPRLR